MRKLILILVLLFSVSLIFAQQNPVQKKIKWLEGNWEGTGYQIDKQNWTVSFGHADRKFSISYPSLGCSGWWKITKAGKSQVEFVENISINKGCDQGDKVIVTKIDDKNISVAWFIPQMDENHPVAFTILYKK
jgi:hypothetical protein